MVKVKLSQIFGAAEASNTEEALQVLRNRWKDPVVRALMEEAAKNGYFIVDGKDFPPYYKGAFVKAIEKLRQRTQPAAPSQSTTVKVAAQREEGKSQPTSKAAKPIGTWPSPEGIDYPVFLYDLPPQGKVWNYKDMRVEEALQKVREFLAKGEVEEGTSLLDEALEGDQNPHFRREVVQPEDESVLRAIGWDGQVGSLGPLLETLTSWEERFVGGVRSITALVDRKGDKVEVVAVKVPGGWEVSTSHLKDKGLRGAIVALSRIEELLALAEAEGEGEDEENTWSTWSAYRVRKHLEKVLPYLPERRAKDLSFYLEVVSALRRTRFHLTRMGQVVRRRAVVYRGPYGEEILRLPVYAIEV